MTCFVTNQFVKPHWNEGLTKYKHHYQFSPSVNHQISLFAMKCSGQTFVPLSVKRLSVEFIHQRLCVFNAS